MHSKIDFPTIESTLSHALLTYEQANEGLGFHVHDGFVRTPEKSYYAKTVVPVSYYREHVGEMHILIFAPKDGTGDENSYALNQIDIPSDLRFGEKPARVIPRDKTGILCEGFFPICSIDEEGTVLSFVNSLQLLTLEGTKLIVGGRLGIAHCQFIRSLISKVSPFPEVTMTVATIEEKRLYDPHAVFNPYRCYVQVGGFLAIKDEAYRVLTTQWKLPVAE